MPNPLSQYLTGAPLYPTTRNLPNGGGSYQAPGTGIPTTPISPQISPSPVVAPPVQQAPAPRSKYINPATGKYFQTAQEYANYVLSKIPASKGTGDVTQYAGDAMTNPNASEASLSATANNLNNTRNDIATGTTDPYKAGNQSGIAYSPAELSAIEKAYAGVYDPALNDVFSRLKTAEQERKDAADSKRRMEEQILATNENIRQWRATTGTTQDGSSPDSWFTKSQINTGASNAGGIPIEKFQSLDFDVKSFYINPPKVMNTEGTVVPFFNNFKEDLVSVMDGSLDAKTLADEITAQSSLSPAVQHYLIAQIPLPPEEKQGYFEALWNAITPW